MCGLILSFAMIFSWPTLGTYVGMSCTNHPFRNYSSGKSDEEPFLLCASIQVAHVSIQHMKCETIIKYTGHTHTNTHAVNDYGSHVIN